jgi:hypothetical protein
MAVSMTDQYVRSIRPEAVLVFGWLVADVHRRDNGAGRAVTAPVDHVPHRVGLTLENRFHPAVPAVADPARDSRPMSLPGTRVAEEHALDPPADEKVTPNDHC